MYRCVYLCVNGIHGSVAVDAVWATDLLGMQPAPELMMESALLGIVLIRNENSAQDSDR